jgi:hypothetical protein
MKKSNHLFCSPYDFTDVDGTADDLPVFQSDTVGSCKILERQQLQDEDEPGENEIVFAKIDMTYQEYSGPWLGRAVNNSVETYNATVNAFSCLVVLDYLTDIDDPLLDENLVKSAWMMFHVNRGDIVLIFRGAQQGIFSNGYYGFPYPVHASSLAPAFHLDELNEGDNDRVAKFKYTDPSADPSHNRARGIYGDTEEIITCPTISPSPGGDMGGMLGSEVTYLDGAGIPRVLIGTFGDVIFA